MDRGETVGRKEGFSIQTAIKEIAYWEQRAQAHIPSMSTAQTGRGPCINSERFASWEQSHKDLKSS